MNQNPPGINKIGKTHNWYANFLIYAKFGMQTWNEKNENWRAKLRWALFVITKFTETVGQNIVYFGLV